MIKEMLLEHLYKMDCIVSSENLERYVDFCLDNDIGSKTRGLTTSHHILPRAKNLPWQQYSDLSANSWNRAELTYYNHYYAHYLLANSLNHISVQSAFCAMHKKDSVLGRIEEDNLIDEISYQHQYLQRNELIRQDRLQLITLDDGTHVTKAKYLYMNTDWTNSLIKAKERMSGGDNPVYDPAVVCKIREVKSRIGSSGKSLDTISAERAAATMNTEFIGTDGAITTTYKENGKKLSFLLKTTDLATRRTETRLSRYYDSCPMVVVKNALDISYNEVMSLNAARKLSPGIDKKTKDDYLGKSAFGRNKFLREGKSHLIGLYAERFPKES